MTSAPSNTQARVCVELAGGTLTVSVPAAQEPMLAQLCGYASRRNPKRGFLFVSKVLGKHIPVRPRVMAATHEQLAAKLESFLDAAHAPLFLGFAETATGLGAGVFEACLRRRPHAGMVYLQSTRYPLAAPMALHFQEEHSHSTGHRVYAPQGHPQGCAGVLSPSVVLVDDELSTGATSVNFIKALQTVNPGLQRVALVSLLNWMSPERRLQVQAELPGLEISFVSLLDGQLSFAPRPGYVCPAMPSVDSKQEASPGVIPVSYGRLGESKLHLAEFPKAVQALGLDKTRPVHVLGDGEFLHPPFLLARYLEQEGYDVYFQSTTRSPILPGLAIESCAVFEDHYLDGIENYAYNLPAAASGAQLVLCHEAAGPLHLTAARDFKTISYKDLLCG